MSNATRKIAFVSPHCILDFTNGAATAMRDGLRALAEMGFDCQAFCGTRLDDPHEGLLQETLFRRGVRYEVRRTKIRGYDARLIFTVDGNLPVTVFENASTRGGWLNVQEAQAFLAACEIFLSKNRPDAVVTYGGDAVSIATQRIAKRFGSKIVFWLHNFSYTDRSAFEAADYVIVPSEFSRRHYRERLGLNCHVLPNIVNWEAAEVKEQMGRVGDGVMGRQADAQMGRVGDEVMGRAYVTFINPHAVKGVYVFARIARELARRRPDIPILVTQGRSKTDALLNPELGLAPDIAGEICIAATARRSEMEAAPRQTESGNEFPHSKFRTAYGTAESRRAGATLGRNITTMPFTPDPAKFYPAVYAVTKLLLMPSLWYESFGLVAAEAMLNGIPVLSSNRGALAETVGGRPMQDPHPNPLPEGEGTIPRLRPEVNVQMGGVGDGEMGRQTGRPEQACAVSAGGYLFDIPARYTPQSREVPSAAEVEPWVETIIRLWDDEAEYARRSQAAREHAQQWRPERLKPLYQQFFSGITHQPGPPFVEPGVP